MDIDSILNWFVKLRVTLVMRSGVKFVFLADKISVVPATLGLSKISWEGARGAPSFIELTQVDLVYWKKVSRWTWVTSDA